MGFTQKLGLLAQGVYSDSSLNVGIGGAPSGSYKFETTGTAKISSTLLVSGVVTFGSTLSNGTYSYTLPGATGTLALTSDIHSAVTLSAIGSTANANGATLTGQVLNLQPADASFGGVVTTGTQTFAGAKTFSSQLTLSSTISNGTYTYTLPSATGTLALTSALTGYLPLTGGTLTGALSGTSATFSGNVGINTSTPDIIGYGTKTFGILGVGSDFPSLQIGIPGTSGSTTEVMGDINFFSKNATGAVVSRSVIRSGLDGATNSNSFSFFTMNAGTLAERMRITSGGNVGIGTTSPSALLHLAAATPAIYIDDTSTSGTRTRFRITSGDIGTTQAALFQFDNTSGTNLITTMVVNELGNVGIGTTSPLNLFDVKGAIFTGSYATSAGARFHDNVYGINLGGIDASSVGVIQGSAFEVGAANIALQPNGGNVGIGTTSPASILDVQQSNATNMGISFMNTFGATSNTAQTVDITSKLVGSGLTGQVGSMIRTGKEGDYSSGAARDAYMSFSVALNDTLTERMRITSAGDVIVKGTLADLTLGSSGAEVFFGRNATNYITANGGAGSTIRIISNTNGVELSNGATSWVAVSDENVKVMTEWKTFINPLEKIISLRAGTSRYKTDSEDISRSFLIAQDVQKVLPEAVSVDEDGILGLRYTEVIPLMIAAIQEQQAQIEELKALIK